MYDSHCFQLTDEFFVWCNIQWFKTGVRVLWCIWIFTIAYKDQRFVYFLSYKHTYNMIDEIFSYKFELCEILSNHSHYSV